MGSKKLVTVEQEKDLGVTVDKDLNFKAHVSNQVSKANKILGMIRRAYTYLNEKVVKLLYTALVRPHLEYAATVWRPMSKGEARKVEDVQRRATKLVPGIRDLPYEERLKKLNLPSMLYRHRRGDMIEVWKCLSGKYEVTPRLKLDSERSDATPGQAPRTRGNSLKLFKERVDKRQRSQFFTQRVVNDWNSLPDHLVKAANINCFKNGLDALWKVDKFRTPYGAFADYLIDE